MPLLKVILGLCAPLVLALSGCNSVPMPKGTVDDARTARFVSPEKSPGTTFADAAHASIPVIRTAIEEEFAASGITFTDGSSDLAINYLLVLQEGATTRMVGDYYGSSSSDILRAAHAHGDTSGSDDNYLPEGAILIDVIDAKTNKLIYRNFASGPITKGMSENERDLRIREAVSAALADFFG